MARFELLATAEVGAEDGAKAIGLGAPPVILEARISLMPAKACVEITRQEKVPFASLALLQQPDAYHVAAFRNGDVYDVITTHLSERGQSLAEYLRSARIDLDAHEPHRSFGPDPCAQADLIVPIDRGRLYACLRWPALRG